MLNVFEDHCRQCPLGSSTTKEGENSSSSKDILIYSHGNYSYILLGEIAAQTMIVTLNSCREGYRRTDSAKQKVRLCFSLDETAAVFRDDRTVPRLITVIRNAVIGAVTMERD